MKTPPEQANTRRSELCALCEAGTRRGAGLLGRCRPISGHLRHACLADRV